ncbi:hypothetical protein MishRS11D_46370 (plasmid) [Methylomagnum ishizawai]|nr:hypothetical protein MishRS11D_46370 [Methylomagnum ishizawai]
MNPGGFFLVAHGSGAARTRRAFPRTSQIGGLRPIPIFSGVCPAPLAAFPGRSPRRVVLCSRKAKNRKKRKRPKDALHSGAVKGRCAFRSVPLRSTPLHP